MQARAIPHIHALIRLDPATNMHDSEGEDWVSPVTATELAAVIQRAARTVTLAVDRGGASMVMGFGTQIDTQPIANRPVQANHVQEQYDSPSGRVPGWRVAGYLAKYVTKSLADFGISARRLSAEAIAEVAVSEHVRAILTAIAQLSRDGLGGIGRWLHTLGYRGHITSKSRQYSTTMTALRARRVAWTREMHSNDAAPHHNPSLAPADMRDLVSWVFDRAGHATLGERTLVVTAALGRIQQRRAARDSLRQARHDNPARLPDG